MPHHVLHIPKIQIGNPGLLEEKKKERKNRESIWETSLIVTDTTKALTFFLIFAETDVSALCIDVAKVKSLAGESRKSVSFSPCSLKCIFLQCHR